MTARDGGLLRIPVPEGGFDRPRLVFTVKGGNPSAEQVINWINAANDPPVEGEELHHDNPFWPDCNFRVFDTEAEVAATFANGHSPDSSVALFDGTVHGHFTHVPRDRTGAKLPGWARGAVWNVRMSSRLRAEGVAESRLRNCAEQLRACYGWKFDALVNPTAPDKSPVFPWGGVRKSGEAPPRRVRLSPEDVDRIVTGLNRGPDLTHAIAHRDYASAIPDGQKFSWVRVPTAVATGDRAGMQAHLAALTAFEQTSQELIDTDADACDALMAGVNLDPDEPRLVDCYLRPMRGGDRVDHWQIRRPDLHVNGDEWRASENDEMPGGFADLVHIDNTYGINQDHWAECFSWLTAKGTLVFVVSTGWSSVYMAEVTWLVNHMTERGYPAAMVTTDELDDRVTITDTDVRLDGQPIGTIWRLFPVFETCGPTAALVYAAQDGKVRMVPAFAHYGNKTWFTLFREREKFFRDRMTPEHFALIDGIMPHSHLIAGLPGEFPFSIGPIRVDDMAHLEALNTACRAQLVLKITGANDKASRSLGVFVGHAHNADDWRRWIETRLAEGTPFIVQRKFDTSVETMGVRNTTTGANERFRCKVLVRPWMVNGNVVSAHCCATPADSTKVHGRVDMAIMPVVFT